MATLPKAKNKRLQSLAVRPQMMPASRSNTNLTSLRAATMMSTKTALPAEIMAMVLDFLAVPDLIHVARTSKRMHEMVYDDTRWVAKLQEMGVWNEAEARQKTEAAIKRKMEGHLQRDSGGLKNGAGHAGVNGVEGHTARRRTDDAGNLIDSGFEEQATRGPQAGASTSLLSSTVSGQPPPSVDPNLGRTLPPDLFATLHVIESARSVRGAARQQYGKIYGALSPYYRDLVGAPTGNFDSRLFRVFEQPEHQAVMLSQLHIFAKSDTSSGWQEREAALLGMSSAFENHARLRFEEALAARDYDGEAKTWSHTLVAAPSDAKNVAIECFLTTNPLLQGQIHLGNALDCLEHSFPGQANLNPARDFFQRLAAALQEQITIMSSFALSQAPLLLEKAHDFLLTSYVQGVLKETRASRPIEDYLVTFSGLVTHADHALHTIDPNLFISSLAYEIAVQDTLRATFTPHMALYLLEELAYCKAQSYDRIKDWDRQLFEQEATAESFYLGNISRGQAKMDFMASFKKIFTVPANVFGIGSSSKTGATAEGSQKEISQRPTPSMTSLSNTKPNIDGNPSRSSSPLQSEHAAPTDEVEARARLMQSRLAGISGLVSVEVAVELVHISRRSIERLSSSLALPSPLGLQARRHCQRIFLTLLEILGTHHIKPGFDKAISHLNTYSARQAAVHNHDDGVRPLVTFLELVNIVDLIIQMVDLFYVQELVKKGLVDADDFMNPVNKEKKTFERMVDDFVSNGLEQGVKVLIDEVKQIIATTQAPTDYNPAGTVATKTNKKSKGNGKNKGNTDLQMPQHAEEVKIDVTDTAKQVVTLLKGHTRMISDGSDKTLIDTFNHEVALQFYDAICQHLHRSRIGTAGAARLMADLTLYRDYISSLKTKDVLPSFEALREVSQVYMVDGELAKDIAGLITDKTRYHGVFRVEDVYGFAERRADWLAVQKTVEKEVHGVGCMCM